LNGDCQKTGNLSTWPAANSSFAGLLVSLAISKAFQFGFAGAKVARCSFRGRSRIAPANRLRLWRRQDAKARR